MSSKIIINNQTKQVTVDGVAINTSTALPAATDQGSVLVSDNSGAFISYTGPTFMRNRIINGDMRVAQRGTAAATTNNSYPVDRWLVSSTITGFEAKQSTSTPDGFSQSLSWSRVSSSSVAASDYVGFAQRIEGLNLTDLAWGTTSAKPITVSFWVYSNVGGTYSFAVRNSIANKNYVTTYSLTANTWQKKSITIPADSSAIATDSSIGLTVWFTLASGSSNKTANVDSWQSGSVVSNSQVDVVSVPNSVWYITGVQLEVGSTATPFEYRPMQYELALCQRYYARLKSSGTDAYVAYGAGTCQSSTIAWIYLPFPQSMRTSPTLTQSNTCITRDVTTTRYAVTAFSGYYCTDTSAMVYISASGLTGQVGVVWCANNNASAYVELNSEL